MNWSLLGKIGAIGAAPFTGGASLSLLPAIDAIGGIASGAAKGSADQRVAEAPSQIGAYNANLQGQMLQDKRAALASLLGGGLQDVSIGRPQGSTIPQFSLSGGLRPSAMNQQSLLAQLSKTVQPLEMPKAGTMEKVLGGVGLGTQVLGAIGKAVKPKAATTAGTPAPSSAPPLADPNVFGNVNFGGNSFIDPRSYGGTPNPRVMY